MIQSLTGARSGANRIRAIRTIEWTPRADAKFAHLVAEGASSRVLANVFGIGRRAAEQRTVKLGLINAGASIRRMANQRSAPSEPANNDLTREPLPPGHPVTWNLINAGTCLEGSPYPLPDRESLRRPADPIAVEST
jgi:hypothetical protein